MSYFKQLNGRLKFFLMKYIKRDVDHSTAAIVPNILVQLSTFLKDGYLIS